MEPGFAHRLKWCMSRGDLTTADLHHWFERPRPTVRLWVKSGAEPRGPSGDDARTRLDLLERAVTKKQGLPPPRTLSALERPAYIRQVRDGLERSRVPARGTA